jgi:hypothetical protein
MPQVRRRRKRSQAWRVRYSVRVLLRRRAMKVQRMPPARAKVRKRPFWIQFIVVSPDSLGCQWAAMPVR